MKIICLKNAFDNLRPRRLRDLWYNLTRVWPDNIRRILKFIPVLWHDWDFDFCNGGYQILKKKLEILEPCLTNGHLLNGPRYGKQIRKVIFVLDRLIASDYNEEELEVVETKWGGWHFNFVPLPDDDDNVEMVRVFDRDLSEFEKTLFKQDTWAAYERAEKRQLRDIKFVFDTIRKWHRHWWD